MNETITPSYSSPSRQGTILYEAHNLTVKGGTGVATYARTLAQAANRLGYDVDGLFGVERGLIRGDDRLNEVLAFDAVADDELLTPLEWAWRYAKYPFNALGGLRPVELPRSGLVIGPMTDALQPFRRVFAAQRLVDVSMAHFKIYGRLAQLKMPLQTLFHVTHPVPLALEGCPNVYTIHDLVPLRLPHTTLDNKRYHFRLLKELARKADHIVTVSEHSRQDIINFLGVDENRVTNTYQAVSFPKRLLQKSEDDVVRDLERHFQLAHRGYYLFYGALEPKKNVGRLIDAYAASGTKRPLIIAGASGWQNEHDLKKIDSEHFRYHRLEGDIIRQRRQVRQLQYLPLDLLTSLVRGARAVVFPSIYEGFGLPVVEAMLLGTPVITSNVSSLPEVSGDAALLIDPFDTESIRQAIEQLDRDDELCGALATRGVEQAKRFSPDAYQARLGMLYDRLING